MLFGYARVSTTDQNLDHQLDALRRAGVEEANILHEVAGGAKASRPQWDILRGRLREGDVLVITKLDRVGRSVHNLVEMSAELDERGAGLRVLDQGIDTSTPAGVMYFHVLAAVAQFERDMIRERTRDGLAAARARGRVGGRKRTLTPAQAHHAQELYDGRDLTVQQIADLLRVPRSTVYGYLDRAAKTAAGLDGAEK